MYKRQVVDATVGDEDTSLQNIAVNDQEHAEKESTRNEVVIVDGAIANYQSIISSIGSDADVFILGKNAALSDIANLLSDRSGVDALHIFTHGSPGTLLIGDHLYDEINISEHADALAEIGSALTETGDILLYGCNIAATGEGQSFLSQFAALTSADVAASDDVTGNLILGGDWDLEHESGSIETDVREAAAFDGVLEPVLTAAGSSNLTASGSNFTTANFTNIVEDDLTNDGDPVSTFLNDDAAINSAKGVAITFVDEANGDWQFSLLGTGNGNFQNFNANTSNALLLDGSNANHRVRFVPAVSYTHLTLPTILLV